jgi:succinoglycan biosynthesis transport protein ExoP
MAIGRRIALVECDLRRPSISRALQVDPPLVGIEKVFEGSVGLDAAKISTDTGVDLFLVNEPNENAHQIFATEVFEERLQEFSRSYDMVVLDSPPVLAVPDVSLIIPLVPACIVVARSGVTPRSDFRSMLDVLPAKKVIGAFVNNAASESGASRYGYYRQDEPKAKGKSKR